MILACSFGMFPPTKTSTCEEEGESKYNPTEAELVQRLVQVWWEMGRGGYGMAGGCNVVMLFVASHSSKGGRYGKGHIPPISSSLGWMLQQVPLKALCYYVLCLCMLFRGEIHFTEPMAWDMSGYSNENGTLSPFKGLPMQRLSCCCYSSSCVRHVVHAFFLSSIAAKIPALVSDPVFQGRLLPTRTWNHGDWCRDTLRGTSAPLEEEHRWCPHCIVQQCRCPGCCEKCVILNRIYRIRIFRKRTSRLTGTTYILCLRLRPFIWQSKWLKHFQLLLRHLDHSSPVSLACWFYFPGCVSKSFQKEWILSCWSTSSHETAGSGDDITEVGEGEKVLSYTSLGSWKAVVELTHVFLFMVDPLLNRFIVDSALHRWVTWQFPLFFLF